MNYFDIEKNLEVALSDGNRIEIVSFRMDEAAERQLLLTIEKILSRYNRETLKDALFACALELATNATKANMKHVFFADAGLDIQDEADYQKGIPKFKDTVLSKEWLAQYGDRAKALGLHVRMIFTHTPDGLRIEIINNRHILPQDEERIRQKFQQAMKYDSLADYFMDNADQTEGEGLGFAMNILLLKGENIAPNLFRIGREERGTVARIEVPFTENFSSIRPVDWPE